MSDPKNLDQETIRAIGRVSKDSAPDVLAVVGNAAADIEFAVGTAIKAAVERSEHLSLDSEEDRGKLCAELYAECFRAVRTVAAEIIVALPGAVK